MTIYEQVTWRSEKSASMFSFFSMKPDERLMWFFYQLMLITRSG